MAQGIEFVPLDCTLDERFEAVEAKFGLDGFAVVVKLFQRIMGVHGYYCEWSDEIAEIFSYKYCGGCGKVSDIVNAAVRLGIFCKETYEKYGVLTSCEIQRRYLKTVKRRRVFFEKREYVLLSREEIIKLAGRTDDEPDIPPEKAGKNADACNSPENVNNSGENACNLSTSKTSKASKASKSNAKQAVTRPELVKKYGERRISEYERRFSSWRAKQGHVKVEMYPEIERWLISDGVPELKGSSFDADEITRQIIESYQSDAYTEAYA